MLYQSQWIKIAFRVNPPARTLNWHSDCLSWHAYPTSHHKSNIVVKRCRGRPYLCWGVNWSIRYKQLCLTPPCSRRTQCTLAATSTTWWWSRGSLSNKWTLNLQMRLKALQMPPKYSRKWCHLNCHSVKYPVKKSKYPSLCSMKSQVPHFITTQPLSKCPQPLDSQTHTKCHWLRERQITVSIVTHSWEIWSKWSEKETQ